MGRLDVTVLVGLANVDPLRNDSVVLHQVAISRVELAIVGKVVDRRAQTIAAMLARHASQLPQSVLKTAAEGLEGLGETNRNGLPIGVGQREMVEQVIERLTGDRNPQGIHVREVRRPQVAGKVDLGKHDFPVRSTGSPPRPNPTLQRPPLGIGILSRVPLLEPFQERKGTQLRLGLQPCQHLGPDFLKGIFPRPPRSRLCQFGR